jgi:Flp pilus assembly protein TadG
MAQHNSNPVAKFASDERGGVAIIFALCTFGLLMITGLAIDMGRLYHVNTKITASIDAAALAAAKGLRLDNLSDGAVRDLAQKFFDADFKGAGGDYASAVNLTVNIDRAKSAVGVDATALVPTLFGRIIGIENFTLPRSSVAIFEAKDIEVGLQLDLTGSMCNPCTKIASLKDATKNLLDILIPDNNTGIKVRVGLAPFSAGVNVGSLIKAVDGNRSAPDTCVYERLTTLDEKTDAAPVGQSAFKIKPDLTGTVQSCPSAKIVPMTDNKSMLKSTVDGYTTGSSTAGQLGASWAWYLVSPKWASIWPTAAKPADYNDGKTIKTVLLMTDGVYNTVGGVNWGDSSTQAVQASKLSVDICNGMKTKGVVVYTVGFDLNNAGAQKQRAIDTLTACATEPGKFFRAENAAELNAAFRAIAEDIVSLRLSK